MMVEQVSLYLSKYCKNCNFSENLGQFRRKLIVLSITASLKFKSKNSCLHTWHINKLPYITFHLYFPFLVTYTFALKTWRFCFCFCCLFVCRCTVKSPGVTENYLYKCFLKPIAYFPHNKRLKGFFYSNCKQFQIFKIVKFDQVPR